MTPSTQPWADLEPVAGDRDDQHDDLVPAVGSDNVEDGGDGDTRERRPSQSQLLVELATGFATLWRTPDREPFATIEVDEHREHWPIHSKVFKLALRQRFYNRYGRAPASQPVTDAVAVLEGQALFAATSEEHAVAVRVAEHDGNIYVDLGGPDWRSVEVSPDGWRVISDPPVRFRRARGMATLPVPTAGGSLELLRPFVAGSDDNFTLIVGWLVQAIRATGPYMVLVLLGEQGSGKSLLARLVRSLIDPNAVALRSLPREDRDLAITANNGFVIALDNVSGLPGWLSDALCRLATGGGFATRELYSDSEETLFAASRPVVLNGIADVASRPDLIDRAVIVALPTIDDADRRDERDLLAAFDAVAPRILGALLDAVVAALHNRGTVKVDRLPRMADATLWIVGAEPALPWPAGRFLAVYSGNRRDAVEVAVESDVVAVVTKKLLETNLSWRGTAGELLEALNRIMGDGHRPKDWPGTAPALAVRLVRLAPALRGVGINVQRLHREAHTGRRLLLIERGGGLQPPPPSPPSPGPDKDLPAHDLDPATAGDNPGDDLLDSAASVTRTVTRKRSHDGRGDDGDDGDGAAPAPSRRRVSV